MGDAKDCANVDDHRIRYQVSSAKPVNYSEEASRLADMINSYNPF